MYFISFDYYYCYLFFYFFEFARYKPKDRVLFLKVNNLFCQPQKKFNVQRN